MPFIFHAKNPHPTNHPAKNSSFFLVKLRCPSSFVNLSILSFFFFLISLSKNYEKFNTFAFINIFVFFSQFAVSQPCLFTVDNAQFIDPESWDFLEDLSKDSHAILVLALRPFSSSNPPCETASRLIASESTKKIKLGQWSVNFCVIDSV